MSNNNQSIAIFAKTNRVFPFQIFLYEFRTVIRNFLYWLLGISSVMVMILAFFPIVEESDLRQYIVESLAVFPELILEVFGLSVLPDFSVYLEYIATLFPIITLACCVFSCWLGSTTLVSEEINGTIETLYMHPISRSSIVTVKLISRIVIMFLFNLMLLLVSIIFSFMYAPKGTSYVNGIIMIFGSSIISQFAFLAFGFACSSFMKQDATAVPLSLWSVIITYILGVISQFSDKYEWLGIFSPWHYTAPSNIITNGVTFTAVQLMIILLGSVASITIAYLKYNLKDLETFG